MERVTARSISFQNKMSKDSTRIDLAPALKNSSELVRA